MAYPTQVSCTKTQTYESYLAPRVAAVQSERRPTAAQQAAQQAQQAQQQAQAAAERASRQSREDSLASLVPNAPMFPHIYGDGSSPTMLPRTPIAPETLLAAANSAAAAAGHNATSPLGGIHKDDNSRSSLDNGSLNGVSGPGSDLHPPPVLDPSSVLAAREKSLISRAMESVARTVAENGKDDDVSFYFPVFLYLYFVLIKIHIFAF